MSDIKILWEEAIAKYEASTGYNLKDASTFKPKSTEELLQHLASSSDTFSSNREKGARFRNVLRRPMQVVELLGGVVGDSVSSVFPPSAAIFGAASVLAQSVNSTSAAYDNIISLFETLDGFVQRLQIYEQHEMHKHLRKIVVEILACILNILAIATKTVRRGRTVLFIKSVFNDNDELSEAMGSLQSLVDQETRMVSTLNLSQTTQIIAGVSDISEMLETKFSKLSQQEQEAEKRQRAERVRVALDPEMSVVADYESCLESSLKGTGDWIYDQPDFKTWKNSRTRHPIIRVIGSPGVGKSYLSSQMIKHLQMLAKTLPEPRKIVTFFFCRDNDPRRRNLKTVLRTLAWQCASSSSEYLESIYPLCESKDTLEHMSITSLWEQLFIERLEILRKTTIYMLIDGSDEAYREELGTFLETVSDSLEHLERSQNLRLLVVGRPEIGEKFEDAFEEEKLPPMIKIDPKKNDQDIRRYILAKLQKSRLKRLDKKLQTSIVDRLANLADGMFLYVNLMIDEISRATRVDQVEKALEGLPRGLSATFEKTFQRYEEDLEDEDIKVINRLLSWILCSEKPPSIWLLKEWLELPEHDAADTSADGGLIGLRWDLQGRYSSLFQTYSVTKWQLRFSLPTDEKKQKLEKIDHHSGIRNTWEPEAPDSGRKISKDSSRALSGDEPSDEDLLVKFCHASLGDFLKSRAASTSQINITKDLAYYWVVTDCINRLYVYDPLFDHWFPGDIAANWFNYFKLIDLAKLPTEYKVSLLNRLSKLFTKDLQILLRSSEKTFKRTPGILDHLNVWLNDKDIRQHASPELLQWILEIQKGGYESLVYHVAKEAAKIWTMHTSGWVREQFTSFDVICSYLDMQPSPGITLTPSQVYRAARFREGPEDSNWYATVGVALGTWLHYWEEGREALIRAIILDEENTIALDNLAHIYIRATNERFQKYEKPLEFSNSKSAATPFEDADPSKKNLYFGLLAKDANSFDRYAEIHEAQYTSLILSKSSETLISYLMALTDLQFVDFIIKLSQASVGTYLRAKDGEEQLKTDLEVILGRSATNLFQLFSISKNRNAKLLISNAIHSCRIAGRDDVIREHILKSLLFYGETSYSDIKDIRKLSEKKAYDDNSSMEEFDIRQNPDNIVRIGIVLKQIYELETRNCRDISDTEISMMEDMLLGIIEITGTYPFVIKETVQVLLATMYFQKFMAEPDGKSEYALSLIKKAKNIPGTDQISRKVEEGLGARGKISMLLCHILNRSSPNEAKALGRSLLQYGIDTLRRFELTASSSGMWYSAEQLRLFLVGMIHRTLVALDDYQNANVAFHLQMNPYPLHESTYDAETFKSETYSRHFKPADLKHGHHRFYSSGYGIVCSGICKERFLRLLNLEDRFWECAFCYDFTEAGPTQAIFCEECYAKLQNDNLPTTVCHKSHTFFHWEGMSDESYKKAKSGILLVGNASIIPGDWLEALAKKHKLTLF